MDTEKLVKNVLKQIKLGTDWISNNIEEALYHKGETPVSRRQEENQYKEEKAEEFKTYIERYNEMWDEPCEFENSADRLKCLKMDLEKIDRVLAKFRLAFSLYKEQLEKEQRQFLKEQQLVGEKLVSLSKKLKMADERIDKLGRYEVRPPSQESGIDVSDIPPKDR